MVVLAEPAVFVAFPGADPVLAMRAIAHKGLHRHHPGGTVVVLQARTEKEFWDSGDDTQGITGVDGPVIVFREGHNATTGSLPLFKVDGGQV